MSEIRSQPHSGCASFSIRIVRCVRSASRLPFAPPRGLSARPPGPCSSKSFFQVYSVCDEKPTIGPNSVAGSFDFCQRSKRISRRSAVTGGSGALGFTSLRPPLPLRAPAISGARRTSSPTPAKYSPPPPASAASSPSVFAPASPAPPAAPRHSPAPAAPDQPVGPPATPRRFPPQLLPVLAPAFVLAHLPSSSWAAPRRLWGEGVSLLNYPGKTAGISGRKTGA